MLIFCSELSDEGRVLAAAVTNSFCHLRAGAWWGRIPTATAEAVGGTHLTWNASAASHVVGSFSIFHVKRHRKLGNWCTVKLFYMETPSLTHVDYGSIDITLANLRRDEGGSVHFSYIGLWCIEMSTVPRTRLTWWVLSWSEDYVAYVSKLHWIRLFTEQSRFDISLPKDVPKKKTNLICVPLFGGKRSWEVELFFLSPWFRFPSDGFGE